MTTGPGSGDMPFWQSKSLEEMTDSEWESLCDGCGRCCLNKLEEEGSDRTYYTDVGCRLLDNKTCRCRDYPNRLEKVEDCVRLTPQSLKTITWLPPSCAYVLLAEGKDLYWWHPLVSGDRNPYMRRASQYAVACEQAKPACPTMSSKITSSAGR